MLPIIHRTGPTTKKDETILDPTVPMAEPEGKKYWRSLEELAASPEFEEFIHREFPDQASEWTDPVTRRQFLTLMGASIALAGVQGCGQPPPEKIVPYVRQPEEIVPGKPLFFATAMPLGGYATGVLAESHMGRPTKIEGNPDHPASLGATDKFAQASVLTMYDPDRSQTVTHLGRVRTWGDVQGVIQAELTKLRQNGGAGLRLLTETVTSPTLARQLESLLGELPQAKWHQFDPVGRDMALAGTKLAFGEYANTCYRFDKADVILSLDADFLGFGPGHLRYVRDFISRRRVDSVSPNEAKKEMNRLYAVECAPTITGAKADHRLPLRASEVEGFARAVAARLGVELGAPLATAAGVSNQWLAAVAKDLEAHRGRSIVIAGEHQSPIIHALAHAMNTALGNVDETVIYTDPIEARPVDQLKSLVDLVEDMKVGDVELLIIVGGNPVYTAPADLEFSKHLMAEDSPGKPKVRLRLHLSLYDDETSKLCHWHIPEAHYLESWSDARAYDGTATVLQPLITPLYGGKSAHELLAAFTNEAERSGLDIVRATWRGPWERLGGSGDFEQFWRKSLHDGLVSGTTFSPKPVTLRPGWTKDSVASSRPNVGQNLEIVFRPDPTIYDGQFANNGWLQELPKPLTKLTWDNAVLMSPATAKDLGLGTKMGWTGGEHGRAIVDVVELRYRDRAVEAPIWVVPGHPDRSVTVHLGYGRSRAGKVGTGIGFNAYGLRTSAAPWSDSGLEVVRKAGKQFTLACTQGHHLMENRGLVRAATLDEFEKNPHFAQEFKLGPPKGHGEDHPDHEHHAGGHQEQPLLSLYPDHEYPRYRWGMAINLTSCVGCSACVTACQAENNIPVIGKSEVTRGREMHWLRIDRYYQGDPEKPETLETYVQPVPCMHCENAPCELVCPVAATAHSDEGLNEMVYNRCVGTRYCSNNCPYKVRRFNFFQYADFTTPSLKLLRNPDVTVRSRGVMEKCSYCVQRINQARIEAEKEDRKIGDGEILTACQAVCPAEAIRFGDLNDPNSKVAEWKATPLNYTLLEELNTRPRTSYLGVVRNPNPEIGTA